MLRPQDLQIDAVKTLGSALFLTDITPVFKKENGKPTDEKELEGYRYVVASELRGLEKIGVKISGHQQIEKPEGLEKVVFEGLTLTAYVIDGKLIVSAAATGIALKNKPSETKVT